MKNRDIQVYTRLLKYEIFSIREKRERGYDKTINLTSGAKIRVTCFETVNQHDKDLLFVLIFLMQKLEKLKEVDIFTHENIRVISANIFIRDISLLLHNNDYNYFKECLERLTSLVIFYSDDKKSEPQRFIHAYKIDEESRTISLSMNYDFYLLCKQKNLTVDLKKLLNLSRQSAKQLYCVLISNSNIHNEDTLIARCGVSAARHCDAQTQLRYALTELVEKKIIKSFKVEKIDSERVVRIEKYQGR